MEAAGYNKIPNYAGYSLTTAGEKWRCAGLKTCGYTQCYKQLKQAENPLHYDHTRDRFPACFEWLMRLLDLTALTPFEIRAKQVPTESFVY